MTKVYLIRHGIAAEPSEYSHDEERPLTAKGYQKTKKVAQRLCEVGVKFDLILTSPLLRAYQTAKILYKAGLGEIIEESRALAPEGEIQNWVDWWMESEYNNGESSLALVGHQPNLGNWSEILVWGSSQEKLLVKKAGIIGVNLPAKVSPIGQGELFLLTAPQWLL